MPDELELLGLRRPLQRVVQPARPRAARHGEDALSRHPKLRTARWIQPARTRPLAHVRRDHARPHLRNLAQVRWRKRPQKPSVQAHEPVARPGGVAPPYSVRQWALIAMMPSHFVPVHERELARQTFARLQSARNVLHKRRSLQPGVRRQAAPRIGVVVQPALLLGAHHQLVPRKFCFEPAHVLFALTGGGQAPHTPPGKGTCQSTLLC